MGGSKERESVEIRTFVESVEKTFKESIHFGDSSLKGDWMISVNKSFIMYEYIVFTGKTVVLFL